jgi:hypothetical protein
MRFYIGSAEIQDGSAAIQDMSLERRLISIKILKLSKIFNIRQ